MDVESRQIIGVHIGNRSSKDAAKLLESIPEVYKKNSVFIADKLDAYAAVFPGILQSLFIIFSTREQKKPRRSFVG